MLEVGPQGTTATKRPRWLRTWAGVQGLEKCQEIGGDLKFDKAKNDLQGETRANAFRRRP